MSENLASYRHVWKAKEYHNNSHAQAEAATLLLKNLRLMGHERVIDIGCGDGKITAEITKHVSRGSVLGIDVSPEMIKFARQNFPKESYPNLTFKIQDAQKLDYQKNFDVAFSSFALQWVADKNSFFKNVYNSLKFNGVLAATIPLGVSEELEQSIYTVIKLPEWVRYFEEFNSGWHFANNNKIKKIMSENYFSIKNFTVCFQEAIFTSRENFEEYVLLWLPYLRPLPPHLKGVFFKKIIDEYLRLLPLLNNGEVILRFPRLDIIAVKAFS